MEAVAALSLGCNVLQLVGSAVQTGQFMYDVYRRGKIDGKDQVSEKVFQLEELSRLSEQLAKQPSLQTPQSDDRKLLLRMVNECANDAKTLHDELKSLRSPNGRYERLKFTLKTVVKNVPNKIQMAKERLEENQRSLDSGVIQVLAFNVQQLIDRQELAFERLDERSQMVLRKTEERFDRIDAGQQRETANVVAHMDQKFSEQTQLISHARSTVKLEEARNHLLQSLRYPGMGERVKIIIEKSENTFNWILDPQRNDLEYNFAQWLAGDEPLYWIQGLAGTGKSTLMKSVWTDEKTKVLAARNSTTASIMIIKHSFWLPSPDSLRKNYKGMLLSTVHDLLSENLSEANKLPNKASIVGFRDHNDWTERDLETAMYSLLADRKVSGYTCVFLDALDEIESKTEQSKVLGLIRRLSAFEQFHTKICVSSRPESPWTTAFRAQPQLRLQDLTKADIRNYTAEQLLTKFGTEENSFDRHSYESFLDEFVDKSQGVFMWTHLAINILLAAPAYATWSELHDRLCQLPQEMKNLYEQILEKRAGDTELERAEAATYLKLCMDPAYGIGFDRSWGEEGFLLHQALPIWKAQFQKNLNYQYQCDQETFFTDYWRLEERILDICACLLRCTYLNSLQTHPYAMTQTGKLEPWEPDEDITRPQDSGDNHCAVKFLFAHRTAADFLTDTPVGRNFIAHCPLDPLDFLKAHTDAEMLRWRLLHEDAPIYRTEGIRTLSETLFSIVWFSIEKSDSITDLDVCRAIQSIKDTLSKLPSSHTDDTVDENLDSIACYTFALAKRQTPLEYYESPWIGFDVEGILLEIGVDVWHTSCEEEFTKPDAKRCEILTTAYKNYLLICATKGNLPEVANHLIEHGADLYTELYLPINNPRLTSAAGQLLSTIGDKRFCLSSQATIDSWAGILSTSTHKIQYQLFVPQSFMRFGLGSEGGHIELGHLIPSRRDGPKIFILDISAHLSLWLDCVSHFKDELSILERNDCVGYWIATSDVVRDAPFEMSIQPLFARSWKGFVEPQNALTEYEIRHEENRFRFRFPFVLPFECCQCLADANDGFWKLFADAEELELHHKGCHLDDHTESPYRAIRHGLGYDNSIDLADVDGMISDSVSINSKLNESNDEASELCWPRTMLEPTNSWREDGKRIYEEYFIRHGLIVDPSDPRVLQKPMRVYECLDGESGDAG